LNLFPEATRQLSQFTHETGAQTPITGENDYIVSEAQTYLQRLRERNEQFEKQYNYAKKNAE
jgi:hypothetical protein